MTSSRSLKALVLLAALAGRSARAASAPGEATLAPWQLTLETWGLDEGLPGEAVVALAQTPDGYLWVGTFDGLARFDGRRFEVYRPRGRSGLRNGSIRALAVDAAGTLWVGTGGGGVVSHSGGEFRALPGTDGWLVRSLLSTPEGLYIASQDHGLQLSRDGQSPRPVSIPGLDASRQVTAIALDRGGRLWVGTDGAGVHRRDARSVDGAAERWEQLLEGEPVTVLRIDGRGRAWTGTAGRGIWSIAEGKPQRFSGDAGPGGDFVTSIAEDADGSMWVGTSGAGVARFRDGRFEPYPPTRGFPFDSAPALLVDREGLVWAGCLGGLVRLASGAFVTVDTHDGLPGSYAYSAAEGPDGKVWAAVTAGLASSPGDAGSFGPEPLAPKRVPLRSLATARDGTLWVATSGLGVFERSREGRWTRRGREEGLPSDTVRAILVDEAGRAWAGTASGVVRREGGRWVAVEDTGGRPLGSTLALAEVPGQGIWIGTDGDGAKRVAEGRVVETLTGREGLPSGVVLSLRPGGGSSAGAPAGLWIGTNAGLARYRDGRVEVWRAADGLPGDSVAQIAETSEWLFIGTSSGVARISRAALDRGVRPLPETAIRVFGPEDGQRSPQCVAPSNGPLAASDGRLWFSTTGGFAVLDPSRVTEERLPPRVVVDRVLADGEEVRLGPVVRLPAGTRRVEVAYTGLRMRWSRVLRFRTRMERVDPDWVDAGTRRAAVFTGLPPGALTFRVEGRVPGGPATEAVLSIVRPPLLSERPAVRLGVVGLGLLLGVLGLRARGTAERRKAARLEALVLERTTELAESHRAAEKAADAWRQTFDAVDSVILLLGRDGIVRELNDAARRLAAPRAAGAVGRRLSEALPGEPWTELARLAGEVSTSEPHAIGHARNVEGRSWIASANLFGGDDARVVVIAREITDHLRLLESLRRSETLSAVGTLVAGVAHEVRNPLFAISANLEVFRAEFGSRPEYVELLAAIEPGVERLSRLMSELLDYARPRAEHPAEVPARELLQEAMESCRMLATKREVSLVVSAAPGLPPVVGDRPRLVQALQNLVENAVEHTPAGGRVSGHAGPGEADGVEFRIEDQGPGLDPEALDRAFEPFFTRRRGGNGLGLAIVERVVEQHGGKVELRNGLTRGAIATVTLPSAPAFGAEAGSLPM